MKHDIVREIIFALALILIGRGIWGMSDKFIFPHNKKLSYFVSIFTGIITLVIVSKFYN